MIDREHSPIGPETGRANEPARDSWSRLAVKLRPFIARRVRSETDVDDVIQEVLLRTQRGLANLRDEERFGPWVYRIARNAIADHHRAALRHRVDTGEIEPGAYDDGAPGLDVAIDETESVAEQQLATYVATFIAMLPSPYREALTLTELEGLTQRAAASMMGISLSGMKSRVQRGREQLRAVLDASCAIALDARGHVIACESRPNPRLPNCHCASSARPAIARAQSPPRDDDLHDR